MSLNIESHGGSTSGAAPSSLNVSYTTPVTDTIIVLNVVSQSSPSGAIAVSSVTDTNGLTWARRSTHSFQGGVGNDTFCTTEVWWAYQPIIQAAGTITINWAAPTGTAAVTWFTVSGCTSFVAPWDTNGALPKWTSNPTNSGVQPTDLFSTTSAGALVFAVKSKVTFLSGEAVDAPFAILDQVGTGVGAYYCFNTNVDHLFPAAQAGTTISFTNPQTDWGMLTDALAGVLPVATLSRVQIIG